MSLDAGMRRDAPIIIGIVLCGLLAGFWLGWQVGWRNGAREGTDRLLCLMAEMSGDHLDKEAVEYCSRLNSPIGKSVAHNAEPHKGLP